MWCDRHPKPRLEDGDTVHMCRGGRLQTHLFRIMAIACRPHRNDGKNRQRGPALRRNRGGYEVKRVITRGMNLSDIEPREDLQATLLEAERLSEAGADAEALDLLLAAEPGNAEDPTLLCMIGALAAQLGAEGMAVDYFTRCVSLNPTDVEVLILAGAGLAAAGDPGAEPVLRLAALTAPTHAVARMQYGALLVRNGLLEQGIEELETSRSLDPDEPETRRYLGIGYLMQGRTSEALAELEMAAENSGEDGEMRLLWGLALLENDQLSAAAEVLYPLGEAMSQDGMVQLLLALTYSLQGWEEEAWVAFSRAEGAEPGIDAATLREAEDALSQGDEAVRDLLLDQLAPASLRERMFLS